MQHPNEQGFWVLLLVFLAAAMVIAAIIFALQVIHG